MFDPITEELFRNAISAIGDEMVLTIYRTAYSGVLKNIMDYSAAICDAEGRLVAQGLSLPGHLCSIPVALQAVLKHFGSSVRALPLTAIDEIFHEVEGGIADFGVVPIENSSEGTVNHTLDMFLTSGLKICGEVELRVSHFLMGKMDGFEAIKRVCAHPQALAQCRGWLDDQLPEVERVAVSSNAEGARRARDERGTAAIAGRSAAEIYSLNLLANEIEDRPDNTTRFLVIGRKLFNASGVDRTTLLVSTSDTDDSGALFQLLEPLAQHRVNMTRIESRPSRRRKWDYVFFIDIEGHVSDPAVAKALAALESRASLFKILGSYPRAVL